MQTVKDPEGSAEALSACSCLRRVRYGQALRQRS